MSVLMTKRKADAIASAKRDQTFLTEKAQAERVAERSGDPRDKPRAGDAKTYEEFLDRAARSRPWK